MLPNSEWVLLALLGVILLKPEDIPVVARFLAKCTRQAQYFLRNLDLIDLEKHLKDSSEQDIKKHPFHMSPPGAKSQPVKD